MKKAASALSAAAQKETAIKYGAFAVNDWTRLERFLVVGTEGGTYYVSESNLTMSNCRAVERLVRTEGEAVVEQVTSISQLGRAPRNDQALFVLAFCAACGNDKTRSAAFRALPAVARIGTHLFQFLEFYKSFKAKEGKKGKFITGRGIRTALKHWYKDKRTEKVAYQVIKYQNREGWSHADALRIAHIKPGSAAYSNIFKYVVDKVIKREGKRMKLPAIIRGFERAHSVKKKETIVKLIKKFGLTREMVPTEFLKEPEVWMALLEKMPLNAMLRNLGNMSDAGILEPGSAGEKLILKKLEDQEYLRKSRVHPVSVLVAMKVYQSGKGVKGTKTWRVNATIVSALDRAFYKCFMNAPVTGKKFLLGIDVSASMGWSTSAVRNIPDFKARDAAAVMALVTHKTEPDCKVFTFSSGSIYQGRDQGIKEVKLTGKESLSEATRKINDSGQATGTDCALPMLYAERNKIPVDVFIVYTDNETRGASVSPAEALRQYRMSMGRPAKLIVVAATSGEYSIADPNDSGMMDIAGFDTAVPALVSDFASDGKAMVDPREEEA